MENRKGTTDWERARRPLEGEERKQAGKEKKNVQEGGCPTTKLTGEKEKRAKPCWQAQYLRVLELCLALNKTPSLQERTDRPTAFCDFMGHTGSFFVSVFLEGWRPDAREELACTYKNGEPVAGCGLEKLIGRLEELVEKWA